MIPDFCEKCVELRGAELATPLVPCKDRKHCLKEMMCDYHCYEMFSLCTLCLAFIQDPKNDEAIRKWEANVAKLNAKSVTN
jgi:hypothetical protein